MADDKIVTVTSKDGGLALFGDQQKPSLKHLHSTEPHAPLMHMVCWDESRPVKLEVAGRLELTGSEQHPIPVKMSHHIANVHHQTMKVDPLGPVA